MKMWYILQAFAIMFINVLDREKAAQKEKMRVVTVGVRQKDKRKNFKLSIALFNDQWE